ncbi:MAG: cation diffusion facilitator family transporter [Candidatus Latescibacterota bacterium]
MAEVGGAYAAAVRAARLTLVLNLLLCVAKLAAGWTGHSFALLADGVNNLTDVGVSAALYLGMTLARRPADALHPYGHGKIEQELTRVVAMAVLVTGGGIIWEAVKRLGQQADPPGLLVSGVAAVSIVLKLVMYGYQNAMARRLRSGALAADALNHKADVAATSCVLLGTGVVQLGGPAWHPADDLAAIAVGGLMVLAAGHAIYRASSELLDEMPPPETVSHIRELAESYPGIAGVDQITGRKSGMHYLIDIHLEVPGEMSVTAAHYLGHQVKDWVMAAMPEVVDIIVHVEPRRGAAAPQPR